MSKIIPNTTDGQQDDFFLIVNFGSIKEKDPKYGTQVCCGVCNTPHPARAIAVVEAPNSECSFVTVCNECSNDPHNVVKLVIREYLAALEEFTEDVPVSARVYNIN